MDAVHKRPTERLDPRRAKHRVADILVDQLVKAGVEVIFGIPGGAIVALNDALLDRPEIRVITTRHESGAMFAAAGYARATGKLGVVLVTSGPGVLNCMTGLATAYCDHVPVLVIAGEVPTTTFGKGALQEGSSNFLNVVGMAKHIAKLALEVNRASAAPVILHRAIMTAMTGLPGPVLLTLPLDITTEKTTRPGISIDVRVEHGVDDNLVTKVANTLSSAERPIILAGSGTRSRGAAAALRAVAERIQCPVMTTPKGKGIFPESHPLSLGVFGYGGHPSASAYLRRGIDVTFVVGSGLRDEATSGWSPLLSPSEHFIHLDIEALHIARHYPVTVGLVGDAGTVLRRLLENLPARPRNLRQYGVRSTREPSLAAPDQPISTPRALWELQEQLPLDTLYTCDIGAHLMFALHFLRLDKPDSFLAMTGLASMGASIPAAMGAKIAHPARAVTAICGDGAFAMSIGDLATCAREQIAIVIAVINDGRYGMVEMGHQAIYGRTPDFACDELDIGHVARGVGAHACVVERPGDLLALDLLSPKGPLVLDIRVDPSVRMPTADRFDFLADSTEKSR